MFSERKYKSLIKSPGLKYIIERLYLSNVSVSESRKMLKMIVLNKYHDHYFGFIEHDAFLKLTCFLLKMFQFSSLCKYPIVKAPYLLNTLDIIGWNGPCIHHIIISYAYDPWWHMDIRISLTLLMGDNGSKEKQSYLLVFKLNFHSSSSLSVNCFLLVGNLFSRFIWLNFSLIYISFAWLFIFSSFLANWQFTSSPASTC